MLGICAISEAPIAADKTTWSWVVLAGLGMATQSQPYGLAAARALPYGAAATQSRESAE